MNYGVRPINIVSTYPWKFQSPQTKILITTLSYGAVKEPRYSNELVSEKLFNTPSLLDYVSLPCPSPRKPLSNHGEKVRENILLSTAEPAAVSAVGAVAPVAAMAASKTDSNKKKIDSKDIAQRRAELQKKAVKLVKK